MRLLAIHLLISAFVCIQARSAAPATMSAAIYVETTRAWATEPQLHPMPEVRGAVRFSCVAAGAPWGPSELRFPIRHYRWRANTYGNTWLALVPYNKHYYHRGEDLGAIPDRLEMPKADLQPKTWSFIYRKEWVNQRW